MSRPRVVIIGSGFGGIRAAKGLAHADVDVTIVDANNYHTFQPLLYQVATAGLDADDIGFPIRRIFRRNSSISFVLGEVTKVDLGGRTVTIADDRVFGHDYLIIAAGTISTSFGIDGVGQHTFPLKTLHDALRLRAHLLSRFERASAEPGSPVDLGVVVVGGGPTGVEMAGGLRELIDKVFRKDYPDLAATPTPITLVEAADRVLGTFHRSLSDQAAAALRRRQIDVELGTGVDHVEADAVILKDGRRIRAGTIIWAAGVAASPVARLLGVELGRGGRIPVGGDLSVADHPNVFAIGDIALPPGDPLPQVAQPAIQEGKHVAAVITARLAGRTIPPFRYRDRGSMATIGRNQAVAELPYHLRFHGFIGWLMWLGLHLIELMGFRNRANVFVNWAWNYLTYDRGSRLLLEKEDPRRGARPE
ncbi:MAG: NAD(P)/FAD-dependent oxidoreductase [Ilumatobacteraceae bacterium]